jgi:NADP-dependent 3-hydroxy acid dehydrogenase YdfG
MNEFRGNVVVITGASEGIGRALAVALAPQGPKLVLAARNAERLESLAETCRAAGAETLVVPGDLTDETQCEALVARPSALRAAGHPGRQRRTDHVGAGGRDSRHRRSSARSWS